MVSGTHLNPLTFTIFALFCLKNCANQSAKICHNSGILVNNSHCKCDEKLYEGHLCQFIKCKNGAKPARKCKCTPGWSGKFCEDLDCGERGIPDPLSNASQPCACDYGYTGPYCRQAKCLYGRQSRDGRYKKKGNLEYSCQCDPGWGGEFCDTIICSFGEMTAKNRSCICNEGYSGRYCDLKETDTDWILHMIFVLIGICVLVGCFCCYFACRQYSASRFDDFGRGSPRLEVVQEGQPLRAEGQEHGTDMYVMQEAPEQKNVEQEGEQPPTYDDAVVVVSHVPDDS